MLKITKADYDRRRILIRKIISLSAVVSFESFKQKKRDEKALKGKFISIYSKAVLFHPRFMETCRCRLELLD